MTDDRPTGFGAWEPDPRFFRPWRPDESDEPAQPAEPPATAPWEDLLDDDEWLADDGWPAGNQEVAIPSDDGWPAGNQEVAIPSDDEPSTDPGPGERPTTLGDVMRAKFSDEEMRAMFPRTDVADDVEERIDDLIPDIDESGPREWEQALLIIANGLDRCAALKQVATSGMFEPIERQLLRDIRAEKERIIARRAVYRDRFERHRQQRFAQSPQQPSPAPGSGQRPSFTSWGRSPDQKTDADYAAERKRIVDETNRYILDLRKEQMEKDRIAAERRAARFNDALFDRRPFVVLADEDYYDWRYPI